MHARRSSSGWTLGLTSIAFFMVALDALVVATALPQIQRDLHAGLGTLGWTVNAYSLTYGAGIITAAVLGDRLGRCRLFTCGLALFSFASAACALAPNAGLLLVARAVQGIGAATVMPLSLTILTSAFAPERRGAVVGIWGAIGGLAVACGPVIGAAITQGIDWHWIFWVNVPVGLIAVVLSILRLPESYGPRSRLDLPGLALITAGILGLVWGLIRAGQSGWGAAEPIDLLAGGTVLLGAFIAWERHVAEPMLPPRLFRSFSFVTANLTAALMVAAIMAAAFLVSQYLQFARGDSPLQTGLRLLPWTATPNRDRPCRRRAFGPGRSARRDGRRNDAPGCRARLVCAPGNRRSGLRRVDPGARPGGCRHLDGAAGDACRRTRRGLPC